MRDKKPEKSWKKVKGKNKFFTKIFLIWIVGIFTVICIRQIYQQQIAENLSHKILRFHVLANSNTSEDQALKLKVRDEIGSYMQKELSGVENLEDSKKVVKNHLEEIAELACSVVAREGYDYPVTASLKTVKFPRKQYGNYGFPAGKYQALQIEIGEGKGKNWWCVMYPNLCFQGSMYEVVEEDAEKSLRQVLSAEEYKTIMESKNFEIKWGIFSFWKNL